MSRRRKIAIVILAALVAAGAIYLPGLYRRVVGLRQIPVSEEAERRAVVEPPVSTSTDQPASARMFWASVTVPGTVDETDVDMKLSADPVERGKQLLTALIAGPPDPAKRTLPPGTGLLEFYLLQEGTAVADFSNVISTDMPSGIQSEQVAVESIADTLAANIPNLRRLKILIDGQETKTLAGHIDLTGYFVLHAPAPAPPAAGTDPAS
jgi:spore germination protein GerM